MYLYFVSWKKDIRSDLFSYSFQIPYIFTLNRWKLGKCCLRKVPISGIGILNHQGSEENVKQILNLLSDLRLTYEEKLSQAIKNVTEWDIFHVNFQKLPSKTARFTYMANVFEFWRLLIGWISWAIAKYELSKFLRLPHLAYVVKNGHWFNICSNE